MKCNDKCDNVKLEMSDYPLKTHMFAIEMGSCDIVLGAEWLRTLGPITMHFLELYMRLKRTGIVTLSRVPKQDLHKSLVFIVWKRS